MKKTQADEMQTDLYADGIKAMAIEYDRRAKAYGDGIRLGATYLFEGREVVPCFFKPDAITVIYKDPLFYPEKMNTLSVFNVYKEELTPVNEDPPIE